MTLPCKDYFTISLIHRIYIKNLYKFLAVCQGSNAQCVHTVYW